MANRLLPFRQYNEHDVVNLFSLDTSGLTLADMTHHQFGAHDAGVLVQISNGDMTQDPIVNASSTLQGYMGKTDYPHMGGNYYPEVSLKVSLADATLTATTPSKSKAQVQVAGPDHAGSGAKIVKFESLAANGLLNGKEFTLTGDGTNTITQLVAALTSPGFSATAEASTVLNAGAKISFTFSGGELTGDPANQALGVTLRQTLAFDENGEKMLYYKQKLLELQGVLPGEAVPVLTKGIITVASQGVSGDESTIRPGDKVFLGTGGKFAGTGTVPVGTCLADGNRTEVGTNDDYFAGSGNSGRYYVIKLDL